jgi:hypothetical protein
LEALAAAALTKKEPRMNLVHPGLLLDEPWEFRGVALALFVDMSTLCVRLSTMSTMVM